MARIMDVTKGIGAHSVLECVGTEESMMQAIRSTRTGGHVSCVGVPHEVELGGQNCSSPTTTCTVALPRCGDTCPT